MKAIARVILSIGAGMFLAGCASVESTAGFYFPYTTQTYPPKPKDAPIPIMGAFPHTPYIVLGKLSFSTYRGFAFLRKSMEYNARRVGADAVVLRHYDAQVKDDSYLTPGFVDYAPVVRSYTCGPPGNRHTASYVTTIPVVQPGYIVNGQQTLTTIDAEMILFKNPRR